MSLVKAIGVSILLFTLFSSSYSEDECSEQPYCSTVNLTTLLSVCRNFFRVPCPLSCGSCSSNFNKIYFLIEENEGFKDFN